MCEEIVQQKAMVLTNMRESFPQTFTEYLRIHIVVLPSLSLQLKSKIPDAELGQTDHKPFKSITNIIRPTIHEAIPKSWSKLKLYRFIIKFTSQSASK